MNREQPESVMQGLLIDRKFDFDRPSLAIAWTAFKEFIRLPLEGPITVTLAVEFSQFRDRDDILWVSFMRELRDPDGVGWSCGCLLSRRAPRELVGVGQGRWWWPEHGTIRSGFQMLSRWMFLGRSSLSTDGDGKDLASKGMAGGQAHESF
jgi:hypothetical protein